MIVNAESYCLWLKKISLEYSNYVVNFTEHGLYNAITIIAS